jgi:hypothetical protein
MAGKRSSTSSQITSVGMFDSDIDFTGNSGRHYFGGRKQANLFAILLFDCSAKGGDNRLS